MAAIQPWSAAGAEKPIVDRARPARRCRRRAGGGVCGGAAAAAVGGVLLVQRGQRGAGADGDAAPARQPLRPSELWSWSR